MLVTLGFTAKYVIVWFLVLIVALLAGIILPGYWSKCRTCYTLKCKHYGNRCFNWNRHLTRFCTCNKDNWL